MPSYRRERKFKSRKRVLAIFNFSFSKHFSSLRRSHHLIDLITPPPFFSMEKFFFAAAFSVSQTLFATDTGAIVFVGDSITQGAGTSASTTDKSVSYRYSLWKNFVDNGITWNPQGSVTKFYDGSSANETQTPNYRGSVFVNNSEGHYGWDAAWIVSGQTDGRSSDTWASGGLADWMKNYSAEPETAAVLIGVNDLSRGSSGTATYTYEEICGNVKNIVSTLQANSSALKTVHVFSILPSAQSSWNSGRSPSTAPAEYNAILKAEVESGKWDTDSVKVIYHDITTGFSAAKHTSDSLHPNEQGCLILAGNIARALGIGQRTAGLERRSASALASQAQFSAGTSGGAPSISMNIGGEEKTFTAPSSGANYFSLNSAGNLVLNTPTTDTIGYDYRLAWASDTSQTQDLTFAISVKMNELNSTAKENGLCLIIGNGGNTGAGLFYVKEDGIYYNASLLYSADMTQDFSDLTISFVTETSADKLGIASGFYIWLEDQLIGESLVELSSVKTYSGSILFGDIGNAYATSAEIASISFEAGTAFSPIPEPSTFGLLAGVGALAFAVARRRRSR